MELKDVASIAIMLVIAGIALALGAEITNEIGESVDTVSTTNETVNFVANDTFYNLVHTPIASVSSVMNMSMVLDTNCYTHNTGQVKVLLLDAHCSGAIEGNYNVSYTGRDTTAYRAAANSTEGLGELASWLPTIGLVIAAGMIIGIILTSFKGKV